MVRIRLPPPRRRGLRIVRDGVFLFKANAVSHSLRRSSSPRKASGGPRIISGMFQDENTVELDRPLPNTPL